MAIGNIDLKWMDFIKQANDDNESAGILLGGKKYPLSVYAFQQSIEKTCKFIGLVNGLITYDELRKIGHEPFNCFKRIFNSNEVQEIYGDSSIVFKEYENFLKDIKGNKYQRLYDIIAQIEGRIKEKDLADTRSYIDKALDFFNSPIQDKYYPGLSAELEKSRDIPPVEDTVKEIMFEMYELEFCTSCEMYLSFIVSGTEANSRYPDDKGNSPSTTYSKDSELVFYLPGFIAFQKRCIDFFMNYWNE